MLRIFNELKPFFEDNYRRIHVREYAKLQCISPPSASKMLKYYLKEGILKKEDEKGYLFFFANKTSPVFKSIQQSYYLFKLRECGLLKYFEESLLDPVVILFGSVVKAEIHPDSDIDIAIFTRSDKEIDVKKYFKSLHREIQIFRFAVRKDAERNPELYNSILNGYKIAGDW